MKIMAKTKEGKSEMSAVDELVAQVEGTDIMKQTLKGLRDGIVRFLGDICREYQNTGLPVPDHHMHFGGYLGETTIKAQKAGWKDFPL
jgi:hypothetical protein